jgi:hypothetical protein
MTVDRRTYVVVLAVIAVALHAGGHAQEQPADDRWADVRPLLGSWEGSSEGQPGKGTVRRSYRLTLREQFVEVQNTSTYPPQERNPRGEVHEDRGFISYDKTAKRLMLRQFHVEGFVVEYRQDDSSTAGRIGFSSASIENIPPGWRARETYIVHGPDEFEEVFELGAAGKPLEVYSRSRLRRVR